MSHNQAAHGSEHAVRVNDLTPEHDEEELLDQALEARNEKAAERREARRSSSDELNAVDVGNAIVAAAPVLASGIVTNLAYDLLKKAIPRRHDGERRVKAPDLLRQLALHAVLEQCRRYDLETPELDDMKVRWSDTKAGATAHVTCRKSDLRARVVIPYEDRESRGLQVWISDVSK